MHTAIVIPNDLAQPMRLEQLDQHDVGAYHRLVAGNLEVLNIDRATASIYLNEDGKLNGLPINHRATALLWVHNSAFRGQDVIVGPAFIVGQPDTQADDTSAPDDLIDLLFERCSRCGAYVYVDTQTALVCPASAGCKSDAEHAFNVWRAKHYRVQVTTRGETGWSGNELTFPDWLDAYTYGINLAQRWTSVENVRVIPDLDNALLETWYQVGLAEPSIRTAEDPPFTKASFTGCYSIEELAEHISGPRWTIGMAFYYRDRASSTRSKVVTSG
jgi:Domain of unknown function (DUF3846)